MDLRHVGILFITISCSLASRAPECPGNCQCMELDIGTQVECSNGKLLRIPRDLPPRTRSVIFRNNPKLKWPTDFQNQTSWHFVTAYRFENNSPLYNLTIEHLDWLPSVQSLTIRFTELRWLEPEVFGTLPELQSLDLSNNRYLEFDPIFNSISPNNTRLEILNMSVCNKLPRQQKIFRQSHFVKLRHSPLKVLDMTSVNIYNIEAGISVFLPELEVLNVSHNHMTIDMRTLCQISLFKKLYVFDISHWKMPDPFFRVERSNMLPSNEVLQFRDQIEKTISSCNKNYGSALTCFPLAESLRHFYFHNIKWSSAESPSIRKCLSPNNMTKCWINNNNYRLLNGSIRGAEKLTLLDLSENILEFISPEFIVHEPVVEVLNLSSNRLYLMENHSVFSELVRINQYLQHIDLSRNNLHYIPPNIFTNNTHLLSIYLAGNSISTFKLELSTLPYLRHIDLSDNQIKDIDVHTRMQLDKLAADIANSSDFGDLEISEDVPPFVPSNLTLDLSRNIFQCQCENIGFIFWLKSTNVSLLNYENYSCVLDGQVVSVSALSEHAILKTCDMTVNEIIMVALLVLSICIIIVILSFILFKRFKRFVIQRKIQKYKSSEPPKYVAFMCYSHYDSEFVLRDLRPDIERRLAVDMSRSEGLLCINDRDFRVGEPIEEAIVRSVLSSSMIILVISEKFMDSQWCKFETNIAWLEKKPILMILREKITIKKLPYLLKNIYNKNTRLTWTGEQQKKEFLENLYKSMLNKLT